MRHLIYQQIRKIQQWPQDWKRSVFILIPKKGNARECSNYHTMALILHASKVITDSVDMSLSELQELVWTGRPGMLRFMGSQRVGRDWVTELNWTEGYIQIPSNKTSAVHEPGTSSYTWWIYKRQRNQRSNCQYSLDHRESKGIPGKHRLHWLCERLWLCRSQQTVKNSERDRNTRPSYLSPEKLVCKSRRNS